MWVSKEFMVKLKWKKKKSLQNTEKGTGPWEEYRNTVRAYRDATRRLRPPWN